MLAALQDRTQYRPTTDSAPLKWIVRHAAWLIPRFKGNDAQSQFYRAMGGPYRGKLLEFGESVFAHLPEAGRGSENPAPKLADRWKSAVWLGKSELTEEHLVRTDEGVVYARSMRPLAKHSWSEENLCAAVETPQKPKATTVDIPPVAEPLPLEAPEVPDEKKEKPEAKPEEDQEMQEEPDTKETPRVASSSRGEKRTEPQENVFAKKRVKMKSPATPVTPSDDPVKRRLLKKTDTKGDASGNHRFGFAAHGERTPRGTEALE